MGFAFSFKRLALVLCLALLLIFFLISKFSGRPSSGNASSTAPIPSPETMDSVVGSDITIPPSGSATIISIQRGGGYAFIEAQLPSGDIVVLATAALAPEASPGATVLWEEARLARNYHSHALNRIFARLYMVTINEQVARQGINTGVVNSIQEEGGLALVEVDAAGHRFRLLVERRRVKGEVVPGARVEWMPQERAEAEASDNAGRAMERPPVMEIEWLSASSAQ